MDFDDWITEDVKNVLLVEPNFPIPNKSRNHSNFLPIGLLKIAAYLREKSINVKLIRFDENNNLDLAQMTLDLTPQDDFIPDLICVTSIFTYWSKYVKNAVFYYKNKYKNVPIIVGGIYASLMPKHCKEYTKCDDVITGYIKGAEEIIPAYDLVDVDYQILHTSRGCIRKCGFCGTYIIEPEWVCKKTIKNEIIKKKLIFYDNNLLANAYIENILKELIELKKEKKITYVESQSGFDGRILRKKPHLAKMLKDAGFKNPKIAWDYGIIQAPKIKEQIDLLTDAGFNAKEISVFMIYNYEPCYEEMEEKRVKCAEWGVQITDCRYRPLNATYDNYSSYKTKGQSSEDYYIHTKEGWTDSKIRKFRRNIRRHNICMRHEVDYHSSILERKKISQNQSQKYRNMGYDEVKKYLPDAWTPFRFHDASEKDYFKLEKKFTEK
ncbi:cobalamin-dependent protein [uncultured Methanobrevibacter sp.]|uniref:cobalamin-dependent protein n=1 Tax=uncultured Methanobrevibacter sp. TaxID=253161 RepID=UPI0025DDF282|nr:cobalamin-dependent protein [uncultured Methanobrevibacter sp.]